MIASLCAIALLIPGRDSSAGVSFRVSFAKDVRPEPASGRLIVLLVREGSGAGGRPIDGPSWSDPQPLFGIDVTDLAPGTPAVLDDGATAFPVALSGLPPGTYAAQARLDVSRTNSAWKRDAGNLFSNSPVTFRVEDGKDIVVDLALDTVTTERPIPSAPGVELFEVRSKLLSDFRGRDVKLRAGVRLPVGHDPVKKYAAVYDVPGFGGDHRGAFRRGREPENEGTPRGDLARSSFWIVLDPEGPNGHTLFADSANNGPCGAALVTELIPALEAKYGMIATPAARLLRGHSSGGWSTLWLAITYPETFGACWSSAPDPVDLRKMQRSNIYADTSMYTEPDPQSPGTTRQTPSLRSAGRVTMTVRQENLMEEVVGPRNTSAQQWDSWLAVWGPRDTRGNPAALYDPQTGALDHAISERYRAYDIGELLRKNPGVLGPIFKSRVRLLVGDQDSFYLNEAVALLKQEVDRLSFLTLPEGSEGYITIVPGTDHGSVLGSPEARDIPAQMLKHLNDQGSMPK